MERYDIQGFYMHSMPGRFAGTIEADERGFFQGKVTDESSMTPEQEVKGKLRFSRLEQKAQIFFFKYSDNQGLNQIVYDLTKPVEGPEEDRFVGTYDGLWFALPYKLDMAKDYPELMSQIDGGMKYRGNTAEVTLTRV